MDVTNGNFLTFVTKSSGWFHTVLNFIGPDNGQGIRIHHDRVNVGSDSTKGGPSKNTGDGRIVIGRYFVGKEGIYPSVQVDELLFFNQTLTESEITMLSQLFT